MSAQIGNLPRVMARLDEIWRAQDAPVAHYAAPGLTDGEMDALAATAGMVIPPELRLWWGWHNGTIEAPDEEIEADTACCYWNLITLEAAITLREIQLEMPRYPDDPVLAGCYWRDSWLPVSGAGNSLTYVDTARISSGGLTPVFRTDAMWEAGWDVPVASSFTAAAATIARVIEEGNFAWSRAAHSWLVLDEELPDDVDARFF
jgi:hypothetical protein